MPTAISVDLVSEIADAAAVTAELLILVGEQDLQRPLSVLVAHRTSLEPLRSAYTVRGRC